MGPVTELPEWKTGARTARARRKLVGEAVAEALVDRDETGSHELLVKRLTEYVEAARSGDELALRASAFEVAVVAGQLVVALDLRRR